MGNFALLAIFLSLLINTEAENKTSDTQREDLEIPLLAKIVPNVVNPDPNMRPPEFAAAIFKSGNLVASGAVLTKNYIVTLCTVLKGDKDVAQSLKVSVPSFNASNMVTSIHNISVTKVDIHPDCGDKEINPARDIGLIRTKEALEHIKYPKLPTIHIPEEKSRFMISNFRVLNSAATTIETTFWYITTRQVDNKICALLFEADNVKFSLEGNLCMAYYHLGGGQNCKSDQGAPLSIRYNDEDTIVGLNLHKHECGHPREAASFVCIRTNKLWIEKVMKG